MKDLEEVDSIDRVHPDDEIQGILLTLERALYELGVGFHLLSVCTTGHVLRSCGGADENAVCKPVVPEGLPEHLRAQVVALNDAITMYNGITDIETFVSIRFVRGIMYRSLNGVTITTADMSDDYYLHSVIDE